MRVLIVTNMTPDETAPARGNFVRNQVTALQRLGVDTELFSFPVGKSHYMNATRQIRALLAKNDYDIVHAHYGLAGWCAKLAGAKPLVVTFHGTDVRHRIVGPTSRLLSRRIDLAAAVSAAMFEPEAGRPGLRIGRGRTAVLPCGADLDAFQPTSRAEARLALGLPADGRILFFPASPGRAVKRHDRAEVLAELTGATLITAGGRPAEDMPKLVNAANAVVVTSENEGFGLAAVEALACNVPVLSTPVGIAPVLASNIEGCLVANWNSGAWAAVARTHLDNPDARVEGRTAASAYGAEPMARRVLVAYEDLLGRESPLTPVSPPTPAEQPSLRPLA